MRDALSRARSAHCSVYRCNLLFNPRIRVCRIVLPALPRLPLSAPFSAPSAIGMVRLYVCGCTCNPRLATCAIPSAIGDNQRRDVDALSRLSLSLLFLSVTLHQSTLDHPRVAFSSSPSPSNGSYCFLFFFFFSFSGPFSRRCSSHELNGERIARRTSGKESTIRPRNWVTRERSRGMEFPLGMVIAAPSRKSPFLGRV